jgi:protein-L-isoaspartate O-methyltransferase
VPQPPSDERIQRMEFMLALRRRGITDQAVLRAMDEVPREHFVALETTDSAYADQAPNNIAVPTSPIVTQRCR